MFFFSLSKTTQTSHPPKFKKIRYHPSLDSGTPTAPRKNNKYLAIKHLNPCVPTRTSYTLYTSHVPYLFLNSPNPSYPLPENHVGAVVALAAGWANTLALCGTVMDFLCYYHYYCYSGTELLFILILVKWSGPSFKARAFMVEVRW